MTQQEHGRDAFLALLRDAAADTEAPLRAWSRRHGTLARAPAASGYRSAMLPDRPAMLA